MGKRPATVTTRNGKTLRSATRLYNDRDNLFKRFKRAKTCTQGCIKGQIWIQETAICATSIRLFSDSSQINTLWPASMAHVLHALERICLKCARSLADNELNTVGVIYKQESRWIFLSHSFLLQPWLNHYVNGRITIYRAAEQKETCDRGRKKKKAAAGEGKWRKKKKKK